MSSGNEWDENKSQPTGERSDIDEHAWTDREEAESGKETESNAKAREQDELLVQPGPVKRDKRNGRLKQWLTPVAAGVIGSVITLSAAPFVSDVYGGISGGEASQAHQATSQVNTQPVSTSGQSVSDMVEEASKAIVGVVNYQRHRDFGSESMQKAGTGSGVVYQVKDGTAYIVTNNHVVEDADKLEVTLQNGKTVKAGIVGTDPLTDIALIKVKAKKGSLESIAFGDSDQVRAGDQVWAIGNPLGLELSRTVTEGIISAADRSIPVSTTAGKWNMNAIQTDAAISPGNSGGALIGTSGEVIGINSMKIEGTGSEGLGFAIPSNQVKKIADQLMKNGEIARPYLGIAVAGANEVPEAYAERAGLTGDETEGVIVVNVEPDSPAGKAGIAEGDLVQAIGKQKISSEAELRQALYDHKSGDNVTIKYKQNGKTHSADITLAQTEKKQQ